MELRENDSYFLALIIEQGKNYTYYLALIKERRQK
jgi:hypothetical protein